jgi:hypothetical protein
MGVAYSLDREGKSVYKDLVVKTEGKIQLWRPSRIWKDNIRMDMQDVGCGGVD